MIDMMELISGLPSNVLGVEATGAVTDADYRNILIPQAVARIGHGPIGLLYVLRSDLGDFQGVSVFLCVRGDGLPPALPPRKEA
jgi:hypothetical protein